MKEKNEIWLLITCCILAVAGTLAVIIFCSGCYTQKAALRQRDKIERNFPGVLSDYCADNFPAVIGDPTTKTKTDTVTKLVPRNCDSIAAAIAKNNPGIDLKTLIDSLKDHSLTTHNMHTIDSVFVPVRDSASETALQVRIDSLNRVVVAANIDAAKSKKGSTNWMISFWGLMVIFAAVGYFLFRSVFKVKNLV